MASKEIAERARRCTAIVQRYDNQEYARVGRKMEYFRKDWTPAQKRRMRKKNKGVLPYTARI